MKKKFLFFAMAFCMICACSKQKNNSFEIAKNLQDKNSAQKKEEIVQEKSPEILRMEKVLSAMSPRCRAAIFDGDKNEFLSDLKKVLETEVDDIFLLVDKKHYLPEGYVPKNLRPLKKNPHYAISRSDLSLCDYVEDALVELSDAAKADGLTLLVSSTYRSFEYQTRLFNRYVEKDGMENALRYSAPPGSSQHQMGVAIDFGSITDAFAKTREGVWLSQNAAKYGWSLSFPENLEDVTGYMWECWHYRYIGKAACDFQKKWFSDVQQFMMEFLDEWKKNG